MRTIGIDLAIVREHKAVILDDQGNPIGKVFRFRTDPASLDELLRRAREGADMLELVSCRAKDTVPMVEAAKRAVPVPVLVKISANWPGSLEVVGACLQAGPMASRLLITSARRCGWTWRRGNHCSDLSLGYPAQRIGPLPYESWPRSIYATTCRWWAPAECAALRT